MCYLLEKLEDEARRRGEADGFENLLTELKLSIGN